MYRLWALLVSAFFSKASADDHLIISRTVSGGHDITTREYATGTVCPCHEERWYADCSTRELDPDAEAATRRAGDVLNDSIRGHETKCGFIGSSLTAPDGQAGILLPPRRPVLEGCAARIVSSYLPLK